MKQIQIELLEPSKCPKNWKHFKTLCTIHYSTNHIYQENENQRITYVIKYYCSGYMSPEYAMEGRFSVKSDVYSFGVLMLEIITGKKNTSYYHENSDSNLIGHVSLKKFNRTCQYLPFSCLTYVT